MNARRSVSEQTVSSAFSGCTVSHGVSWLAGFIDGEGTFVLTTRSRGGIAPYIGLTAGNEDNIRAAKAVISEIVGHEVRYSLHRGASARDRRPFWYLHVQRLEDVKKVCEAIRPFAHGKRPNIDVMLRYVAIAPRAAPGLAYGDARSALVREMRALNLTFARGQWQALREEAEWTAVAADAEDPQS
jgi:hypothetical protein